jgi:hypothetical protein
VALNASTLMKCTVLDQRLFSHVLVAVSIGLYDDRCPVVNNICKMRRNFSLFRLYNYENETKAKCLS